MSIDLRLPSITGPTDRERLSQMQRYLYQLVEQLQWGLNNMEASSTVVVTPTPQSLMPSVGGSSGTVLTGDTSDPQATFNSIKALIIQSADIVEAYYDEINKKLEGQYVAQSDFGVYSQHTSNAIEVNATGVSHAFDNIQTIEGDVRYTKADLSTDLKDVKEAIDNINYSIIKVKANIESGLLYYDEDGVPVYGIEVGQKNIVNGVEVFYKFARFTADRLSFYDQNGIEVAYISDYKLYITHAEVTGTLKIGGYLVETTKGVTFRWVGRS